MKREVLCSGTGSASGAQLGSRIGCTRGGEMLRLYLWAIVWRDGQWGRRTALGGRFILLQRTHTAVLVLDQIHCPYTLQDDCTHSTCPYHPDSGGFSQCTPLPPLSLLPGCFGPGRCPTPRTAALLHEYKFLFLVTSTRPLRPVQALSNVADGDAGLCAGYASILNSRVSSSRLPSSSSSFSSSSAFPFPSSRARSTGSSSPA